jgi:hypothetical protein
MSTLSLEDGSLPPWTVGDDSGLFSLSTLPAALPMSAQGVVTTLQASSGTLGATPIIERHSLTTPIDLRPLTELRFWLRSSRPSQGSSTLPFYLIFEAARAEFLWQRLLVIERSEVWQLQRLWLGDMPPELRQGVTTFRLRSLDATLSFSAALGDLLAVMPEAIQDAETALWEQIHGQFSLTIEGVPTAIDAAFRGSTLPALPYVLITPWSIQPQTGRTGELVDNYRPTLTGQVEGAFVRPMDQSLQLAYAIEVVAAEWRHRASLTEQLVRRFSQTPFLMVAGEPLGWSPFQPSSPELAAYRVPGQTPLFYQLTVPLATGDRTFRPLAVPFIVAGSQAAATSELVSV